MSRSPMIRAINVSQTGFRIRSPMILLFKRYSSLWIRTRNTRAAIASFRDTVKATKTITVLLTRLPTIGTRPQTKGDCNEQWRMRQSNREKEYRGQDRID